MFDTLHKGVRGGFPRPNTALPARGGIDQKPFPHAPRKGIKSPLCRSCPCYRITPVRESKKDGPQPDRSNAPRIGGLFSDKGECASPRRPPAVGACRSAPNASPRNLFAISPPFAKANCATSPCTDRRSIRERLSFAKVVHPYPLAPRKISKAGMRYRPKLDIDG